jgi:hypothetical protein
MSLRCISRSVDSPDNRIGTMNWTNIFRSRHSIWLEEQLREVRSQHEQELARVESLNQTIQFEAMRERVELKKAHAAELTRVIEENQKLRDDLDRVRLLLTPALQSVELPKERTEPPKPTEIPVGTPWQRVQQEHRMRWNEIERLESSKQRFVPAPVVEGEKSNGGPF